jgi:hypothetical protein
MSAPLASTTAIPRGKNERWTSVTQPTAFTRFWRTFLPWQLYRFVAINLKMVRIIARGHH